MLPNVKMCGKLINKLGVDAINVYDFDNTLYNGESTLDFYFFCCRRHILLFRFVFIVVFTLIKYKMCLVSEQKLMELCGVYVRKFLDGCSDIEELAESFWKKNKKKLKSFYKELHRDDDVIVSASFGFLLGHVMKELGVKRLVCSEVDLDKKEVTRLCYRNNKRQLFEELFPDCEIQDFYTDSFNDRPLMEMAVGNVYLVKGEGKTLINIEKQVDKA